MESIEAIRKQFIDQLVHKDLKRAFYVLRQNIDRQSIKYDDLNILHIRYTNACRDQHVKGILSFEEASVQNNQIYSALLDLINELQPEDLAIEVAPSTVVPRNNNKSSTIKGKILYRVPGLMEIEKEYKCIVRIAFTEEELEYLKKQDNTTKIEPVRISEVMSVQFLDESNCDAFAIRTRSTEEQFIDRGDFTEWIFYVKPLLEGIYDLILKVSVVEKRYGREVKKDIVLEKKIKIVAEPIYDKPVLGEKTQSVIPVAAGAFPLLPLPEDVFEVANQSILLEVPPLPPLNPGIDNLSGPYWMTQLINLGTVVALSALIAFFISDRNIDDGIIESFLPPLNNTNTVTLLSVVNPIQPIPAIKGKPPKTYLKLSCKPQNDLRKLKINVKGNQPPFKIFVNKKRKATIKKSGDCFIPYPSGSYANGQNIVVEVEDNRGKKKSTSVEVMFGCDVEQVVKPMQVADCFDFDQFDDKCSILFLYEKGKTDNWKMRKRTFLDCEVVDKIKEGSFKFFQMDINSISSNCSNKAFSKLTGSTTFVYRGGKEQPIQLNGFIEPSQMGKALVCLQDKRGEDIPTPYENPGVKNFPISLTTNTTYLYRNENSEIGFSIKKVKPQQRVRIAAFSIEENFKSFIKNIEELDLGYPMAIRLEAEYYKVYLGGYENKIQAETLLNKLQQNNALNLILEKSKIKKIFVDKV